MKCLKGTLILLVFLCACNDDFDMGMQYQKHVLAQKNDIIVYCYSLSWASEAYFISFNKDVCWGFDSTKDYCYGRGSQLIYYKFQNDTLKLYSYGSIPTIPKTGPISISLTNITQESLSEYEKKFQNKEIEKVAFDSLYKLPCELTNPPINLLNVRFKSH